MGSKKQLKHLRKWTKARLKEFQKPYDSEAENTYIKGYAVGWRSAMRELEDVLEGDNG